MNKLAYGLSFLFWILLLLVAVILTANINETDSAIQIIEVLILTICRSIHYYIFLFLYQIVLAIFIAKAFISEYNFTRRAFLCTLWGLSFLIMFLNVCIITNHELWLYMSLLTPACCLICGLHLIARCYYLSGTIVCSIAMCVWLVPMLIVIVSSLCGL